jgi:hypothetical protein
MNGADIQNQSAKRVPVSSLVYMVTGFVAMAAFGVLGVRPVWAERQKARAANLDLKARFDQQATLLPLYVELQTVGREKTAGALTRPPRTKLGRDQIVELPGLFAAMARETGVEMLDVAPRARMVAGGKALEVTVRVRGAFPTFRDFLLKTWAYSPVRQVTAIQIVSATGGEEMELRASVDVE